MQVHGVCGCMHRDGERRYARVNAFALCTNVSILNQVHMVGGLCILNCNSPLGSLREHVDQHMQVK